MSLILLVYNQTVILNLYESLRNLRETGRKRIFGPEVEHVFHFKTLYNTYLPTFFALVKAM